MALKKRTIAFIGGGHITEIIVSNLTRTDTIVPRRLIVSDPVKEKLENLQSQYSISIAKDNMEAVLAGEIVFINVLPNVVGDVVDELGCNEFPESKVIVTVAAGIPMRTYEVLGDHIAVVRALPNPPSQVGMGIAALSFNPHVPVDLQRDIYELFSCLGEYVEVREEHINAVMALSSPVITYTLFQSLIDAGVRAGLDRETAIKIVYQTITGSMEVWKKRQIPPYELISEASTPGGISIESMFTLDKHAFKASIMEAIHAAIKKADSFQ